MRSDIRKILYLIIFLSYVEISFAQTGISHAKVSNTGAHRDNISATLFTGKVNYSIPIYTLDDPDFPLDITLQYQSDGFKPFQPSGHYGQDWELHVGGYVARIVQGFPDEQQIEYFDYNNSSISTDIGMLHAIQDGDIPDKNQVFNMHPSVYNNGCGVIFSPYPIDACWWQRDYMPDIFYFNFMGYHGCFMINNQGKPIIINGDFVNIDMSRLSETYNSYYEYPNYTPHSDSLQITITTNDGYKFIFGGSSQFLEYTVLTKPYDEVLQDVPAISKWNLSTIIAPNGRTMSFRYQRDTYGIFNIDYDWTGANTLNDTTHLIYTLYRSCIPFSITTSDSLTISFFSSEELHKKYEHSYYTECRPNLQLDSIIVSYGNRKLKTARLTYASRHYNPIYGATTDFYWRYLSSVYLTGEGSYSMTYNTIDPNPESAPPFMHDYIYPYLHVTTDNDYKALVDRFGFWKKTSMQGLLSEVSLPTGGKIRFTYGNHQYSEERRFRVVNSRDIELYSVDMFNQSIGGARIEKIETFSDVNKLVETKTFVYTKRNTTASSGIFYNIYELFDSNNVGEAISNPNNYGMISSHIGYSYVQKNIAVGNETYTTAYTFDTGHNTYTSVNNPTINRNINVSGYADSTELHSGSLTFSSHIMQTGKILAVEQYSGNAIKKGTYYRYNGITNTAITLPPFQGTALGCIDTLVCLSIYSGHIARKLFIIPTVLEQTVTYEYDNAYNSALESVSTFTYDSQLRKKEVTSIDSRGIQHFTRYTYPDDICADTISPLFLLKRANRISSPIEVVTGYKKEGTEYITSGAINIYAKKEQSASNTYYPYLYKTMELAAITPIPIQNYQPLSITNGNVTYDSKYRLTCEYDFDNMNRPLVVKPYGALPTTYTWGGIYPSTKKIGNQIWAYTYFPYVGLKSMIDPRGISTYYSYDEHGRLIETYQIVNGVKQILNFYQYHIKTE